MAKNSRPAHPSAAAEPARPDAVLPGLGLREGVATLTLPQSRTFRPGIYNILLDGHALAQISLARPAPSVSFSLPPHNLPHTVDLVSLETGGSHLSAPIPLDPALDLRIERLLLADGRLVFEASMAERPVVSLAVLALTEDGSVQAVGLAMPGEGLEAGRTHYRALLPLVTLLPVDVPRTLTVHVSGRQIDPPLQASGRAMGIAGHVDHASADAISGWLSDLRDPARRMTVDVKAGDRLLGQVVAAQARPDLAARGIPDQCGFTIPKKIFAGLGHGEALSILVAGTATHLAGSPKLLSLSAEIRGLFDNIDGNLACGWVIDLRRPTEPCTVEAVCDGRVVGEAVASGLRRDVLEAGMPTERCGFRIPFTEPLHTLFGRDITVRIKGTDIALNGGPQQPMLNPNIRRYLTPDRGIPPRTLARLRRHINHAARGQGLSIVMPVYNTKRAWLMEALRSVCTQWCEAWELICVDDCSTEPQVQQILSWFAQTDPRIRVIRARRNLGIAGATTLGMREARHPYLALMDHDDVLEPDAVHHLLKTARETGADFIYSDEAITTEDSSVVLDVRARPAFSYDYYLSHPYFVHMVALRTEIAQRIGGFDERLAISADVDFILRAIEQSRSVAHVPRVLYRWRTHGTSTGHTKQAEVMAASTASIQRHLDRVGAGARARPAAEFNQFEIAWPDPGGRVLILIPTKDGVDVLRQCIAAIERTTPESEYRLIVIDHESKQPKSKKYLAEIAKRHTVMPHKGIFNYALMNNLAVRREGRGEPFVLFMNNDIEVVEPGWLQRMRSLAARPDTGIVGTALMYSDKRVQHGGVILGINDLADHALRFEPVWQEDGSRTLGYNSSLPAVRDFSAVTAACMMMRMAVFEEVNGFDEAYLVGFNDTDLCLRVGRAGYKIIYDGRTVHYHHESVTRSAKGELKHPRDNARLKTHWAELLRRGDPYYSPILELYAYDHRVRVEEGGGYAGPRIVPVDLGRTRLRAPEAGPAAAPAAGGRRRNKAGSAGGIVVVAD
ncbi:MAG TPA: glycosyltransferase family 2 protein [Acidisoma sp.]|uniref:glycosyltransferase family 2 protein n=1 Tax=Acidisoma sp. TaxID=1872115 RepID=UPI002C265AC5|nr:glycosyltransferase family 2 protein [Acidisoma sp.]HTH99873.1 glycosyltransferase family 2 protein [Acidisoma sp.]